MPATDALQPPLSAAERKICKSYGGWTRFMQSMGLKPWDDDDAAEGKAILEAFVKADADDAARETNNTGNGAGGSS